MIWRDKTYELRYRLGRLMHYMPNDPDIPYDDEAAFVDEVREYNNRQTRHTAEATTPYGRRKKQITDDGDVAIEQVGVLLWFPADKAVEFTDMLTKEGWGLQQ